MGNLSNPEACYIFQIFGKNNKQFGKSGKLIWQQSSEIFIKINRRKLRWFETEVVKVKERYQKI